MPDARGGDPARGTRRALRMAMDQTTSSRSAQGSTPPATTTDVVSDVKELATKVAGQAKGLVADQVNGRQEKSAGDLGKVADAIRQTGESLQDTVAGPYVEKAAAMIERVSGSVKNANLRDTMRATERFAQRDPVLFLGGAFLVGLLAGRFLKSSAQHEAPTPRLLEAGTPDGGAMMGAPSMGAPSMGTSRMGAQNLSGRDGGY